MDIHAYSIKLIDPLFYSHEALSGAYTQRYLHATAVNHAVAWAMGRAREEQSYVTSDAGGGRNAPRYTDSWIEPDFYFTPAAIDGAVDYLVETIKGDMDYLIQPGFGQAKIMDKNVGRNEVLKAYRIFSFPPETSFSGYLHVDSDTLERIPSIIRLGSFRGKAALRIGKREKTFGARSNQYVSHPVDPLVSTVKRGVMIGMFPYPVVDNALAEDVIEIREHGKRAFVAIPAKKISYDSDEIQKRLNELRPGFDKVKDVSLPEKDRAYLVLHMLRSAISIKHFLMGVHGEERLDAALKEIEGVDRIRSISKGVSLPIGESLLLGILEMIRRIIDDCEGKIKGVASGKKTEGAGSGSSALIL